jgi:hypothetical protein
VAPTGGAKLIQLIGGWHRLVVGGTDRLVVGGTDRLVVGGTDRLTGGGWHRLVAPIDSDRLVATGLGC